MSEKQSGQTGAGTGRVQVLSLGAGVQSTALALLAVEGILPKPDVAVFADTGWEPQGVYDHLDRLTAHLAEAGIPVVKVAHGNLRDDVLDPDVPGVMIPAFVRSDTNPRGFLARSCTGKYKLDPVNRHVRTVLGATTTERECSYCSMQGRRILPQTRGSGAERWGTCSVCRGTGTTFRVGPAPRGAIADVWIGFSTDEIVRVSDSRTPYTRNVFPLLDLNMSRTDCERWLTARGWTTTKSACIGCPYHGNAAWRTMRDTDPTSWTDAIAFDTALREMPGAKNRGDSEAFLHRSRIPLPLAPIDVVTPREWADRQAELFDAIDEDGDPDGCSPYGCRSGEAVAPEEAA